jgi:hypothetical protein
VVRFSIPLRAACSGMARAGYLEARQRISPGSKAFQLSDGWMVMPTRRREATMPIDSITRIAFGFAHPAPQSPWQCSPSEGTAQLCLAADDPQISHKSLI